MTAIVLAALLVFLAPLADSAPFHVSPPANVVELDAGQLHGQPVQLGWAPDSGSLYLETMDGTPPNAKDHFFVVDAGDKAPKGVDAAPSWAAEYWRFKSNRAAPAHADLMIQVENAKRTGGIPTQSLADRAAGTSNGGRALQNSLGQAMNDASGTDLQRLTLGDTVISELAGEPLVPGVTFGWAPAKYDAVAFRNERRHGLSIYRIGGPTIDVGDTKDILLPAWSPDGTKIAFLERTGKKKYELRQVQVSLP